MQNANHAAVLFQVEKFQIRKWVKEFNKYFSDSGGRPPKGRQSDFTDDDLRVISLIKKLSEREATNEQIHESLARGNRAEIPKMSSFNQKSSPPNNQSRSVVAYQKEVRELRNIVAQAIDLTTLLTKEFKTFKESYRQFQSNYAEEHDARLTVEGQFQLLQTEYTRQLDTNEQLNREIGQLQFQLRQAMRREADSPPVAIRQDRT